jgi:hypothetical protein
MMYPLFRTGDDLIRSCSVSSPLTLTSLFRFSFVLFRFEKQTKKERMKLEEINGGDEDNRA